MENLSTEEAIKVICEDYTNKTCKKKDFIIQDYLFNELKINIEIKKHPNWNKLVFDFTISEYEKSDYHLDNRVYLSNREDYEDSFETIEELITFLFENFRDEYVYSKSLDEIDSESKIKQKEKLIYAYSILCENDFMDECCVCMESNKVITDCGHNVCRPCYANIKYSKTGTGFYESVGKACPICRRLI